VVQTGFDQYPEEMETGLQPMRMKEKCIQKKELVQTGSDQYPEEVETDLQPMKMKEKCIQKRIGSGCMDLANI
jgi:hypothetical protein